MQVVSEPKGNFRKDDDDYASSDELKMESRGFIEKARELYAKA